MKVSLTKGVDKHLYQFVNKGTNIVIGYQLKMIIEFVDHFTNVTQILVKFAEVYMIL
jgi:hypothetical protein